MADLKDSKARRGGATARYWYETVDKLRLSAAGAVRIKFSIAGNKNGETQVEVDLGPNDFPTLLETMCVVDREAALAAMAIEMARQIQMQPERDAKIAAAARAELQELSARKYNEKPVGQDDNERTIMNGIAALNNELSKG